MDPSSHDRRSGRPRPRPRQPRCLRGRADDRPALTAAGQAFAETPSYWRTLDPKAAALLVELGAEDQNALEVKQNQVLELVSTGKLIKPVEFTSVAEAIELAWHVREGLLGLIGKNRPEGSTLIKVIGRVTSTRQKPLPMRCGAGAMAELFPSSSTPLRAPLVSKRT